MDKFSSFLEWVQQKMLVVGAVCLMGMATLTCCDIVGRFFNYPIFGGEEIVTIFAVLVIGFTLPYAHSQKSHIGVEMLTRLLSQKKQDYIKVVTDIIALILFLTVAWRMALYARTMQLSGEVSMNLELPEYGVIYVLSFCFAIFSLFIFNDIILFFKKRK
ncbi:MAG: C4-dicarboxylate ABC transporter permease [Desulfobacteraceae bacterium 4572_19]|nr:MAG: C4-dicarboxylate ABC transporter permease [Desulfobacteraceae bacterium 4572_19]